jgi:predicted signal transduction protein with EAL and GGDEF domain
MCSGEERSGSVPPAWRSFFYRPVRHQLDRLRLSAGLETRAVKKIDGTYISKLHQDRNNQFFLRSLTDIAHNLEIKIVANFVEDEAELKSVLALGMDGAQGYHIGKPESQG